MKKFKSSLISKKVVSTKNSQIHIFITSIASKMESEAVKCTILSKYPSAKIDFDLEDIDNVLRVEGIFNAKKILKIVTAMNLDCKVMD
jgi:hypothetical protein